MIFIILFFIVIIKQIIKLNIKFDKCDEFYEFVFFYK